MRALTISRPGGPEVLEVVNRPDPVPGPEDVLVRVRAAALNRADLLQRRGLYPAPAGVPPDIPGLELSGEVEACGSDVRTLAPGDRVMAIVAGGAQAERAVVHAYACLPVPGGMSFADAAAIPEAFLTAFDALHARAELGSGESVLVDAAGSGVGLAAIALAASERCVVIALSRSSDKRRRLAGMGVAHVFDPAAPGLVERIREATGGAGVDVVIDLVGASAWARNVEAAAPRARLVLVGTLGGSKAELDISAFMHKRLTAIGTILRSRPIEEKIELAQAFRRRALPLLERGHIRPFVDRVLPLSEAAAGHAAMERNENFGKIVLTL